MRVPVVHGTIERRILLNYRVDPAALRRLLPPVFEPKLIDGLGMAGVCLVRLSGVRPAFVPAALGVSSENAAHRIAVTWHDAGRTREGVFIPRRDTSSRFNTFVGGWLFPGLHHHARFDVDESDDRFRLAIDSDDRQTRLRLEARVDDGWPSGSIFKSLDAASMFFERGSLGYSLATEPGRLDALELRSRTWTMQPLKVEHIESSYFADKTLFPAGSATFDSALLMRGIEHEWLAREPLSYSTRGRRLVNHPFKSILRKSA